MAATSPVPVVLEGRHVRIEPLTADHVGDLAATVCGDDELWRWMPVPTPTGRRDVEALVAGAVAELDAGTRVPFAVVMRSSGLAVGSTSFLDIAPLDERVEIGWTFLARDVWRTAVNSEAKLLLIDHAFGDLGMERVALKTDAGNERSQAAISRLGAVREGVLRHHRVRPDGTRRDTVYFSVLREEWPSVRRRLVDRLGGEVVPNGRDTPTAHGLSS